MTTVLRKLALVGILIAATLPARAQLTIAFSYDGTNVTMTYNIAANTSLGTSLGTQSFGISGKDVANGQIRSADSGTNFADLYSLGSAYTNALWGTSSNISAISRSGDLLWTAFANGNGQVYVPQGYDYTSGLSGQMTWDTGWDLTDVGFASNNNASGSFTVGVLTVNWSATNTTLTVPEPSTYAMLAGLGALGLVFWRRRMQPKS